MPARPSVGSTWTLLPGPPSTAHRHITVRRPTDQAPHTAWWVCARSLRAASRSAASCRAWIGWASSRSSGAWSAPHRPRLPPSRPDRHGLPARTGLVPPPRRGPRLAAHPRRRRRRGDRDRGHWAQLVRGTSAAPATGNLSWHALGVSRMPVFGHPRYNQRGTSCLPMPPAGSPSRRQAREVGQKPYFSTVW